MGVNGIGPGSAGLMPDLSDIVDLGGANTASVEDMIGGSEGNLINFGDLSQPTGSVPAPALAPEEPNSPQTQQSQQFMQLILMLLELLKSLSGQNADDDTDEPESFMPTPTGGGAPSGAGGQAGAGGPQHSSNRGQQGGGQQGGGQSGGARDSGGVQGPGVSSNNPLAEYGARTGQEFESESIPGLKAYSGSGTPEQAQEALRKTEALYQADPDFKAHVDGVIARDGDLAITIADDLGGDMAGNNVIGKAQVGGNDVVLDAERGITTETIAHEIAHNVGHSHGEGNSAASHAFDNHVAGLTDGR